MFPFIVIFQCVNFTPCLDNDFLLHVTCFQSRKFAVIV